MPRLFSEDLDHVVEHTRDVWDAMRGSRVFITGGTGFVGTWLIESLAWANKRLGVDVSAVVLTRDPDAFRARAPHLADCPSIQFHCGNICSFDYPDGEFRFVVHAATERYFEPDAAQPLSTFDHDIEGTRRVLEFARSHGCERLLFTSSGAVYGKQPPEMTHIPEDYAGGPSTMDPRSVYGQAKRVSEFMCMMYARQYGFAAVIARLFAFVGPHLPLDLNFAVGNFVRDVLAGGPVRIAGDGTPYRSYLYAADMAIWLWTMLMRGKSARPYNVGSGEAVSIAELARVVVDATMPGMPVQIAQQAKPGVPPARYVPSVNRTESELGLCASIGLGDGVRRMYKWHRNACSLGRFQPIELVQ